MEEWVAKSLPADEYCFWWVLAPTVVFGRNQDMYSEVNLEYCREHGIDVQRRRSGGGCIFADGNNVMTSFVTPSTDVQSTFADFTRRIAGQLRKMGIPAEATGRNDIAVDGRKISGNSFYHLPGRSIVHGTMLYDTDMEHMLNAITPSRAKLESKQVKSVASHIVTARELRPDLSFADFCSGLADGLADSRITLTAEQVAEIEAIEQGYYDPAYLSGRRRAKAYSRRYFPGVGQVEVSVKLMADGTIDTVTVTGDFMDPASSLEEALGALRGKKPAEVSLPEGIIDGLPSANLAEMIANPDIH